LSKNENENKNDFFFQKNVKIFNINPGRRMAALGSLSSRRFEGKHRPLLESDWQT